MEQIGKSKNQHTSTWSIDFQQMSLSNSVVVMDSLFEKWYGNNWLLIWKIMTLPPYQASCMKISLKDFAYLIKNQNINTLARKIGEKS